MIQDLELVEKKTQSYYAGKDILNWISENEMDWDKHVLAQDLIKRQLIAYSDVTNNKFKKGCFYITEMGHSILNRNLKLGEIDNYPKHLSQNCTIESAIKDIHSTNSLYRRIRKGSSLRRSVTMGKTKNYLDIDDIIISEVIDMTTINPLELARQITLLNYESLSNLKLSELDFKSWKNVNVESFTIDTIIEQSNRLSQWAKTEILTYPYPNGRIIVLKNMIKLAQHLKEMDNYMGMISIILGLTDSTITRVTQIWDELEDSIMQDYKDLRVIASQDNNFSVYRNIVKNAGPPFIPYIGVILNDMYFIEEGNQTFIDGHININKMLQISNIKSKVRKFQSLSYQYTSNTEIQNWYRESLVLGDRHLYKMSLKLLPRKKNTRPTKGSPKNSVSNLNLSNSSKKNQELRSSRSPSSRKKRKSHEIAS
eukprot:TRINITY_DN4212_c0_g1_i2.p1 TRINITY_DN4212_c0_g1~~TRINITY_DN4212_c0_g1_i2.p1  ORF type:complete len:425 (-),score=60.47 TRINITY_DN4212_c0_g1_i2:111-1385(-)